MSARTASLRCLAWPAIWAMLRRIIFHSAGRSKPRATLAQRQDGSPPGMLWHSQIPTKTCGPAGPRAHLGGNVMQRTKPPFRADMVGSLLRTAPVKQARAQREKGAITPAQLKEVEDREIEKIIKKQEEIGLKLVTDGEFRRAWWHFDFFSMLDGVELYELDHGIQFQGGGTNKKSTTKTGQNGFVSPL